MRIFRLLSVLLVLPLFALTGGCNRADDTQQAILEELKAIRGLLERDMAATGPHEAVYSAADVAAHPAAYFTERMLDPQPGYHGFAGLWGFIAKGKDASQSELREMLEAALAIATDESKPFQQRFQCLYAVSAFEEPWVIPELSELLRSDADPKLRSVVACALGSFEAEEARVALQQALPTEPLPENRQWIVRALAGEFPRPANPAPQRAAKL